ncbi:MAG TPA: nuclear transport factor 2 family protein [Steroidobacteraceae bacterium]|nr:nuclear transport factor 2 family protein [Steroidobacteraceae bacterium]
MSSRPAFFAACLLLCCLCTAQAEAVACKTAGGRAAVSQWFGRLNEAWEERDAAAAAALFSRNASYWDDPFGPPHRGMKAIRTYWDQVSTGQRDVHTSYEVLSSCGGKSLVHWTARFTRFPSAQKVRLDGIAEIILDRYGKASSFREWWNREQN